MNDFIDAIVADKVKAAETELISILSTVKTNIQNRVTTPFYVTINFECSEVQANNLVNYLQQSYDNYVFTNTLYLGRFRIAVTLKPEIATAANSKAISAVANLFNNLAILDTNLED